MVNKDNADAHAQPQNEKFQFRQDFKKIAYKENSKAVKSFERYGWIQISLCSYHSLYNEMKAFN